MKRIFGKPLVTQEHMRTRIKELGRQISEDYVDRPNLLLIGIMKGAFLFYADLVRAIRLPLQVDFLVVSSYEGRSTTSGKIKMITELTEDIKGRDILLVEDIVDSGLTVQYLRKILGKKKPRSLAVCALLSKPERRKVEVAVEYIGFEIPNKFVVGYGLDYQQKYRNLPYLAVLDDADMESGQ
ncbi:MAG: hypoxanthine phosphoribosyltransferase [Nitrospirales bacterium]|nr:hypoxanthine phosphoribosyltransferase [Nitrospirales bacterium]